MVTKHVEKNRWKIAGPSFITVDSIARYCMVSRTTVGRWLREGKLSSVKLPSGHFRVTIDDFRTFLERNHMPITRELQEH
jgi:excisionase family DNA binding protein